MNAVLPADLQNQVSLACAAVERHLAQGPLSIHLFGSAVDGGLKPHSDIDLLVTVSAQLQEPVRRALLGELLTLSASPGSGSGRRPLELTVVARPEVVPWRYPARRELQFGEWLRRDLLAGVVAGRKQDRLASRAASVAAYVSYVRSTIAAAVPNPPRRV